MIRVRYLAAAFVAAFALAHGGAPAAAQVIGQPPGPCTAFGQAAGTCMQGNDTRVTSLTAVTGAVKENGAGAASQAACGDLSNASPSCATDATNAANIASGTLAAARGGAGTLSGLLKGNGAGVVSAAAAGTDYAPATSGAAILYGNGAGGFSAVTIGAGLTFTGGSLSASGGGGGGSVTSVVCPNGTITTTGSCNPLAAAGTSGDIVTASGSGQIGDSTVALSSLATLGSAQTFTAAKTFTNSDLKLLGSSTGATTFASANSGASNFTLTVPAATDTLADLAGAQTLTNKTIAFASNTLTGVAPLASPTFTGTVTGPDSTTWKSTGIKLGASAILDLNATTLMSASTPALAVEPPCPSGAGGATVLIFVSTASFCTNATAAATDSICIGTISCGAGSNSLTIAFGLVMIGSENARSITAGSYGTGVGFESLHSLTSGQDNVGFGAWTLQYVTTGTTNTAIGHGAGGAVSGASSGNTCIASLCGAGNNQLTGSNNTCIGPAACPLLTSASNVVMIANGATNAGYGIATLNGCVIIGSSPTLTDQADCFVLGDGDGHTIMKYVTGAPYLELTANGAFSGSLAADTALMVGGPTGGLEGSGTLNIAGAYYANGTVGVTCASISTATATSKNGLLTHC